MSNIGQGPANQSDGYGTDCDELDEDTIRALDRIDTDLFPAIHHVPHVPRSPPRQAIPYFLARESPLKAVSPSTPQVPPRSEPSIAHHGGFSDLQREHESDSEPSTSSPGELIVAELENGMAETAEASEVTLGSGELTSEAPSEKVDVRVLGSLNVTVDEIAAFFPNHRLWDSFMLRFRAGGWDVQAITKLIAHYRGGCDSAEDLSVLRTNVQHKFEEVANRNALSAPLGYDFSSWVWSIDSETDPGFYRENDIPLVDLDKGLVNWPEGAGARHLTLAAQHALKQDNTHIMLCDVNAYVGKHNIGANLPAIDADGNSDKFAWYRLRDTIH